jgi:acid stress-induced BolA-like protein IbaG/YrbA
MFVMNVDLIKKELNKMPNLQLLNVTGDGMHFQIQIVSQDFDGKNKLSRQRLVYQFLKSMLADGSLHAVELQTFTPLEWESSNHE